MKSWRIHIVLFFIMMQICISNSFAKKIEIQFAGSNIALSIDENFYVEFKNSLNNESINHFYNQLCKSEYKPLILELQHKKDSLQLNDWLFYQLVRHTAEAISPKDSNYYQYTLYKWFLLSKSGFDATISFSKSQLLFYVKSEDNIYGIPYFMRDGNQYICLNYHDYNKVDTLKETIQESQVRIEEGIKAFSYKVTIIPDLNPDEYIVKNLDFNYKNIDYSFQLKLNPAIKSLFNNYPVADFETYFNIPLSKETYQSLIPDLKKYIGNMSQRDGVDYLMRFTRYSFLYQNDQQNFGKEKRLSPEQTLSYEYSDCDDRAGLFFYLVKEIYDLPMIVLLYPTHVNIAIDFDQRIGTPILYKGKSYSVCDPTPQKKDFKIGDIAKEIKHHNYQVVYEYNPIK